MLSRFRHVGQKARPHVMGSFWPRLFSSSLQETVDQARELYSNYRYNHLSDAKRARELLDQISRRHTKEPLAINAAVDLLQRLAPSDPQHFNPILNCWKNLILSAKGQHHIRTTLFSLDSVMSKLETILPGDQATTGILLQVMLQQKPIAVAQDYVETQSIAPHNNAHIYNQLLKAHVDQQAPFADLQKVLDTMQVRGVARDKYTYSILMHYWRDDLERVHDILTAAANEQVDATCWTQYVQYHTHRNVVNEALEQVIMDRIAGKDAYQTGIAARSVLEVYQRRLNDKQQPEAARTTELAENFLARVYRHVDRKSQASLWCVLMDMHIKEHNYEKATQCFDRMKKPGPLAYRSLIRNFSLAKQPEKASEALHRVLQESAYRIDPTVAMFNMVLEAWVVADHSPAEALEVWDWMQYHAKCQLLGLKPDTTTFELLIRLYIRNGMRPEKALENMVRDHGLEPNTRIYMLVLESLFVDPDNMKFLLAESFIRKMRRTNATKCAAIVKLYPNTLAAAIAAVASFEASCAKPITVHSFNLVLAILAKSEQVDLAWSLYERHSYRFQLNPASWTLLLGLMEGSEVRSSRLQAHQKKYLEEPLR